MPVHLPPPPSPPAPKAKRTRKVAPKSEKPVAEQSDDTDVGKE